MISFLLDDNTQHPHLDNNKYYFFTREQLCLQSNENIVLYTGLTPIFNDKHNFILLQVDNMYSNILEVENNVIFNRIDSSLYLEIKNKTNRQITIDTNTKLVYFTLHNKNNYVNIMNEYRRANSIPQMTNEQHDIEYKKDEPAKFVEPIQSIQPIQEEVVASVINVPITEINKPAQDIIEETKSDIKIEETKIEETKSETVKPATAKVEMQKRKYVKRK